MPKWKWSLLMSANWGNKRQSQHKEQRDDRKTKTEIETLRADNNKLRKQVSRLEKQLEKYLHQNNGFAGKPEPAVKPPDDKKVEYTCKKCNSAAIKVLPLGPRTLFVCENCGERSVKVIN